MMQVVHLRGRTSSLIIKVDDMPEILHWGQKVPQLSEDFLAGTQRAIPQARLDSDIPLTLCPESGRGQFGAPGIEGHRNGQHWAPVFSIASIEQPSDHGVIFHAQDAVADLTLNIELSLDPESDVLQTRMAVTNTSSHPYTLNKLASTLPLPGYATELMHFYGSWIREFHTERKDLSHGSFIQENRRGRTSHENFPGLMVGRKGFTEQAGDVWGFHLGWSGNHQMRADAKSDGRRFVQAGELLFPGEMILDVGASYTTPWLYGTFSRKGLNGVSQHFHKYVRENIIKFPNGKPRPVHLNTWEGIYFDHSPEYIMKMATGAAAMGVERFIVDDGWFIGRDHDRAALGDWYLDEVKYPQGLEPLIGHVNKLGMEFGLWVEPEMINEDSNLFRNHPDWLLKLEGYNQPSGRWQYVLDLQNPDCFQYLFDRLNDLLTRYNIGYLKWDMNRELVQPGHKGQAAVHKQTQALYRLIDELRMQHPAVEIESCSSGGGRVDYEILKRTQRFWASDCNDALERQTIQKGMGYFFPPEVIGAHIGPEECHSTKRRHSINLRGLTALFGHMGVELDPVKEPEEQKAGMARYIALHKQFRPLIHSGQSFRLDCTDPNRQVYGVMNDQETLVVICQEAMSQHVIPEPLRFIGLDQCAQYKVSVVDMPEASFQLMKARPLWLEEGLTLTGGELMDIGLAMPLLDPEAMMLIHLVAC
ncbi:alpha-galactosidase [Sansalvadorimonas verongulae]|uniref:alpha-galactosidase n=1 Tax=Sansalvadorimonas verongulae TaxID=2172824 RepID=UPI0012BBD730|nr:alpha-galactosidase [Sansalvadorimonas verongulae]MTI13830.1 alpha-galactosidase [Sansalvadorimonas verongulae]